MKRYFLVGLLVSLLLLTACGNGQGQPGETLGQEDTQEGKKPDCRINMALPAELEEVAAFSSEDSAVYSGENLTLTTQILTGNNLEEVLLELTGRQREDLTLLTTWQDNMPKHQLTWTCAGEAGMQICQSTILDDGSHYYVVTAMVPETSAKAYQERIAQCLGSARLTERSGDSTQNSQENQSGGKS